MVARHPGVRVADVAGNYMLLLEAIRGASLVRTSSLHALVAADAMGVPQVYEPHPGVIGGDWKFNDYFSAFGESARPGAERLTPPALMAAKQAEVRAQLESLPRLWTRG
jgi:hypothetical protein